jgi:hypothetical protein
MTPSKVNALIQKQSDPGLLKMSQMGRSMVLLALCAAIGIFAH